jgi:hypothetical protein
MQTPDSFRNTTRTVGRSNDGIRPVRISLLGSGHTTEEQALGLLLRTREGLDRAPLQRVSREG